MAKGQKRGNREAKKPKQVKVKAVPAASPYALMPSKPGGFGTGRKK
jgi:hypothetical protein